MTNVTLIRLHEPDQVREILTEAIAIADEFFEDGHKWQPVFIQAATMLAARVAVPSAAAAPIFTPHPLGVR